MIRKPRTSSLLAFLDVDLSHYNSGESSSDESFNIENHKEDSDFASSSGSDSDGGKSDSEEEKSSDDEEPEPKKIKADDVNQENQPGTSSSFQLNIAQKLLEQTKANSILTAKLLSRPVCCACLGDRSDDSNEIVECDGCKITVHEGCYGVSESVSVSSTVSSCSTEPWFCEACKANVKDPDCELCPNRGGIFKETDCGKWVHLVCALYVPGIAFGDVDQLSSVTLFEMQYNKWGSKTCTLCEDKRFERTGVCIGCDAGMCKTYFHVTW
jgi:PHD-zinc-finger like domain/PHD-finger